MTTRRFSELVKTLETGPLFSAGEPHNGIVVRVEVFRAHDQYYSAVWFREFFRMTPLMPLLERQGDEEVVVSDVEINYLQDSLGFEECRAPTVQGVVKLVAAKLAERGLLRADGKPFGAGGDGNQPER